MSSDYKPLVSICIPTYNGSAYIEEAMRSAISQTYPNLEIVISDDASHDQTLAIVDSFKSRTAIPISIYHHEPKGIGANWNHCMQKAQGDYIKFLFQDDVLFPDCISRMMALMLQSPSIGLVYSKRQFIYAELNTKVQDFIAYYGALHGYWDAVEVKEGILPGKLYLKDRQFLNSPKNKIGEPSTVLLNALVVERVGLFSEVLQQTLDSEYWYRIMRYYDIGFVDAELVQFRLHAEQASQINKELNVKEGQLVYKRYYKELFWYLHPKNQWKLLKLFHPILKPLVALKQKFYA